MHHRDAITPIAPVLMQVPLIAVPRHRRLRRPGGRRPGEIRESRARRRGVSGARLDAGAAHDLDAPVGASVIREVVVGAGVFVLHAHAAHVHGEGGLGDVGGTAGPVDCRVRIVRVAGGPHAQVQAARALRELVVGGGGVGGFERADGGAVDAPDQLRGRPVQGVGVEAGDWACGEVRERAPVPGAEDALAEVVRLHAPPVAHLEVVARELPVDLVEVVG